jgi:hypothetical protein
MVMLRPEPPARSLRPVASGGGLAYTTFLASE